MTRGDCSYCQGLFFTIEPGLRKGSHIMGMLEGKVAIVTGSGRGIGAAAARMFGAEGAAVIVSDLDPAPAEETAAAIRNAGGKAIIVVGDVTNLEFPGQLIKATLDTFGG